MPDTITLTPQPAHSFSAWTDATSGYTSHSCGWYVRQQGMARPYTGEHRLRDQSGRPWSRYFHGAAVDDFGDLVEVAA